MNTFVALLFIVALDMVVGQGTDDDTIPLGLTALITNQLQTWDQFKCRAGFVSYPPELMDATYHCSGQRERERLSQRKFTPDAVDFSGTTPYLCLRSCIFQQSGFINADRAGINETGMLNMLLTGFTGPGGNRSAFRLTKSIQECAQRHPTTFPKQFYNCEGTEDFFSCFRRTIRNCEDSPKWDSAFNAWNANKAI